MANRDKEDTLNGSATGERRQRQKRALPKPLLRGLLILAAIAILVVVIVVIARAALHSGQAAEYQRYMTEVEDILDQSDTVGDQLVTLLTDPGDINRTQFQNRLDKFVADSESLKVAAEDLDAPSELVDRGVHQMFLLVMSFRQMGLADLKQSLMGALEAQGTEVALEQITHGLYYLTNSDFLYKEVFMPRVTTIITEKGLTGVTVPSSQFISDPDLASKDKVQGILAGLKRIGNLQAVHGVALVKVVALPDEKEITAGGTFNLTASDQLAFIVTVENQGNMDEEAVKIVVTLLAADSDEPQKATVTIDRLESKSKTTVRVEGINPTDYGVVALLKVKVGPVPDEKYNDNNSIEANVIFKL
jgi:hypothetical protein